MPRMATKSRRRSGSMSDFIVCDSSSDRDQDVLEIDRHSTPKKAASKKRPRMKSRDQRDSSEESEKQYEVEKIMMHTEDPSDGVHYLVKWKGFDEESWEPEGNMTECAEVIRKYWQKPNLKESSPGLCATENSSSEIQGSRSSPEWPSTTSKSWKNEEESATTGGRRGQSSREKKNAEKTTTRGNYDGVKAGGSRSRLLDGTKKKPFVVRDSSQSSVEFEPPVKSGNRRSKFREEYHPASSREGQVESTLGRKRNKDRVGQSSPCQVFSDFSDEENTSEKRKGDTGDKSPAKRKPDVITIDDDSESEDGQNWPGPSSRSDVRMKSKRRNYFQLVSDDEDETIPAPDGDSTIEASLISVTDDLHSDTTSEAPSHSSTAGMTKGPSSTKSDPPSTIQAKPSTGPRIPVLDSRTKPPGFPSNCEIAAVMNAVGGRYFVVFKGEQSKGGRMISVQEKEGAYLDAFLRYFERQNPPPCIPGS